MRSQEKVRRVFVVLLLCLFIALLCCVSQAEAYSDEELQEFRFELAALLERPPPYVWGGAGLRGVDCYGLLMLAGRRVGWPIHRVTANRAAVGEGGWVTDVIPRNQADILDLVWWTFDPGRHCGHIGIFWEDVYHVAHASGESRGVVIDEVKGCLDTKIEVVRRLRRDKPQVKDSEQDKKPPLCLSEKMVRWLGLRTTKKQYLLCPACGVKEEEFHKKGCIFNIGNTGPQE